MISKRSFKREIKNNLTYNSEICRNILQDKRIYTLSSLTLIIITIGSRIDNYFLTIFSKSRFFYFYYIYKYDSKTNELQSNIGASNSLESIFRLPRSHFLYILLVLGDVIICEHCRGYLTCPAGSVIAVQSANYGRTTDGSICPHSSIQTTTCGATGSLSTVQEWCEGKPSCELQATNAVFSDPCVNTYKYLQVGYTCETPVVPTKVIVCEGKLQNIVCTGSKRINVVSANYGRTAGANVCPHTHIQTTQCSASTSLTVVQGWCQGRPNCILRARNDLFGDPCFGTYKYLEVDYICE